MKLYIEFGQLPKSKRFGFAVKVGKGKVLAKSPSFGSRATARTKAHRFLANLDGGEHGVVVWEVPELKA